MTQSLSISAGLLSTPPRPADGADAFGGRLPEGEALVTAHTRAQQMGGGVVLLTGPMGVGKGKLLTGLRQSVARGGKGPVFSGSALGQHRPYAPVADAMREALVHLDTLGQGSEVRARHPSALAVLDPSLLLRPDGAALSPSRLAFHEVTLALLRDVGARTSATFILSELEAGDEDTRALCRYLAEHLCGVDDKPGCVLVLAVSENSETDALMERLRDVPHVERVQVGGLDKEGLLRFLRNSVAVDRLLSASGGRPGDIDELLSALPLDVGTLLHSRLDRLGEKARAVAEALAVCETPMGVDALSAMTGLPAVALAPVLQGLCEEGLADRRVANGALLFGLKKPAHGPRLLDKLPDDARRRLHRTLGEHLEAKGAALMEGGDQHLAEHFLAAHDAERGVPYALSASERLTVTHAYGAAVDLLNQALPLATRAEDRQAILARRCELHQLRGDLKAALVDGGRHKASLPSAERAGAYRRLGELLTESGRPRLAVRQLERALSLIGPTGDVADRAAVLATLAEALYIAGDRDAAQDRADEALALGGTPETVRIRIRNTLGKLALVKEAWSVATRCFQENLERAAAGSLSAEVTRAEINLGVLAFRRGQYEDAERHLGRALKLAEETADLPNQASCVLNLASVKHQRRDLAAALRMHHESLALYGKLGNRSQMARAHLNVANLCLMMGDLDRAEDHLGRARPLMGELGATSQRPYLAALEGDLLVARGQAAQAREQYAEARQRYTEMGQRGRVAELWLRCAQAALRQRDLTGAEESLSHLTAARSDLDHPRLKAEAALAHARLIILSGLSAADAVARTTVLLDEARSLLATPSDPEALAMVTFVESELWIARGDTRRGEKLDGLARDQLHKMAAELPPALRDGYVRSRSSVLGGFLTAARTLPRFDITTEAPSPVASEVVTSEDPSGRSEQWNTRYKAMVGHSPALLKVFARLDKLQGTTSTVLIRGESGTGKELIANAIHGMSPRASGPFIKVNCAALVETLLLSELFGHEKGSFTGAHARKVGRFELARGGTIFLDEIGDISAKTQVSLLRVLQERVFERVGGATPIRADCRVICATNRNLEAMVKAGTFREDLYYRLKGVQVELPPLRERRADIGMLVEHVARAAATELDRPAPKVSAAAQDVLSRYDWPGNIRELENAVRSLVLFAEDGTIDVEHLKEFKEFSARPAARSSRGANEGDSSLPLPTAGVPLGAFKKQIEFEAISRALEEARGNISRAAELLQMKRPRLSQIVNGNPQLRAIKDRYRSESDGGGA